MSKETGEVNLEGSGGVDTDRLMKELGQFRRFHMTNYVLLALPIFMASLYAINYVFLAGDVPYRSVTPARKLYTGYNSSFYDFS